MSRTNVEISLVLIPLLTIVVIPVISVRAYTPYDIYTPPLLRVYPIGFSRYLPHPFELKILVVPVNLINAPLPEDYLTTLNEWLEYASEYWFNATKGNVRITFKVYPKPILVPYRAKDIGNHAEIFEDFIPPVSMEYNAFLFVHASVPFEKGNKEGIWSQAIRYHPDNMKPSIVVISLKGFKDTLIHEIGHLLGLEDEVYGLHKGVTFSPMGFFLPTEHLRANVFEREPLPVPYPSLPELWIADLVDRGETMAIIPPHSLEGEITLDLYPISSPHPRGIFIPMSFDVEDLGFGCKEHRAWGYFVEVRFLRGYDEVLWKFDLPHVDRVGAGADIINYPAFIIYNYTMRVEYDSLGQPYHVEYKLIEVPLGFEGLLSMVWYPEVKAGNGVCILLNQTHDLIIEVADVDYDSCRTTVRVYVRNVRSAIISILTHSSITPIKLAKVNDTFYLKMRPYDERVIVKEETYDYYYLPIEVSLAKAGEYKFELYIDGELRGRYLRATARIDKYLEPYHTISHGEGWVKFRVDEPTQVAVIFKAELRKRLDEPLRTFKAVLKDLKTGEVLDEYEFKIASTSPIRIEVVGNYTFEYKVFLPEWINEYFGWVLTCNYSLVYNSTALNLAVFGNYSLIELTGGDYIVPAKRGRTVDIVDYGYFMLIGREYSLPLFNPAGHFIDIKSPEGAITFPKKITIQFVGLADRTSESFYVEYVAKLGKDGITYVPRKIVGALDPAFRNPIKPEGYGDFDFKTTIIAESLEYNAVAEYPLGYYIVKIYPYEVEKVRIRVVTPSGDPVPIDVGYVAPPYGILYMWYYSCGFLECGWDYYRLISVYSNLTVVNEPPIENTYFPAFQFFKVNYLGNGTYEYYIPKGFTVPIYFIYSKPLFDKENRILALDVPLGYIDAIESKLWKLGTVTGGKDKEVTFVVPLYKLTINTTDPEILDKITILYDGANIGDLACRHPVVALWNNYTLMRKHVDELLEKLTKVKTDEELHQTIRKFLKESSHIYTHYLIKENGQPILVFRDLPCFPLPNTSVYRVGNTWYLPPYNYTVYYGGTLKEVKGKVIVEGGLPIAKISLKNDVVINLNIDKETLEKYKESNLTSAIAEGIAYWILFTLPVLTILLIIYFIKKWRIMKKIKKLKEEVMTL